MCQPVGLCRELLLSLYAHHQHTNSPVRDLGKGRETAAEWLLTF